jgi:two-component system CitB family sensor kinase
LSVHATPWRKRIVTQALVLQLAVIAAVLLIISAAFALTGQDALEEQYGIRAQSIAESVAENPDVRSLVADSTISPEVQEIAEAVRLRTGVSFVVVTDVNGIRHSHPNPDRIGKPVSTDPGRALAGISDWYVQTGTLGPSVRGKVPIWGPTGEEVVGIVSVGVLTGEVSETFRDHIASLVFAGAVAFAAGAIAAYLGARRIRRQTLGLEPPQIASLFEHRDGMLRSLHEGVVAVDSAGMVTLVNEEAASALGLDVNRADQRLADLPHLEPLHALAHAPNPQRDVPVQIGTQTLLVTSAPITIRDEQAGAVVVAKGLRR